MFRASARRMERTSWTTRTQLLFATKRFVQTETMPRLRQRELIMSEVSKEDWTKPAAMAIPKGGFFEGKTEQGSTARFFQRPLRATASP